MYKVYAGQVIPVQHTIKVGKRVKSAFLSEINWSRFAVPWRSDQALPSFLPAWPGKPQCNTALCFVGAFHFRNAFKFAGTLLKNFKNF